jgi:hypothetical protein
MVPSIVLDEAVERPPARRAARDGESELSAASRVVFGTTFLLANPSNQVILPLRRQDNRQSSPQVASSFSI